MHSPEKRSEHISSDTEVHLAVTPLQPVVFFGFPKRMSVTGLSSQFMTPACGVFFLLLIFFFIWFFAVVVGTVEGGRAPTKIKTDLKKPIVNIACHPRLPVLVCYSIQVLCLCGIWLLLDFLKYCVFSVCSVCRGVDSSLQHSYLCCSLYTTA